MKKNKKTRIYEISLIIICTIYLIGVILLPYNVIEITKKAVFIWYSAVMPSLFPYFLIINILIQTNYFYLISIIFKPIARFIFNVSSQGFLGYVIGLFAG